MGLFDALDVSGCGLSAERLRMDVTSENLANAQTHAGRRRQPYRRKEVVLRRPAAPTPSPRSSPPRWAAPARPATVNGVQVAGIVEDPTPAARVYDPGHPDADAEGYVTMPNVNTVTEMVDLISARAPTRPTSPRCRRPRPCSPRRSICSADADRPHHPHGRRRWSVGAVGSAATARRRRRAPASGGPSFASALGDQLGQLEKTPERRGRRVALAGRRHRDRPDDGGRRRGARAARDAARLAAAHQGRRGHQDCCTPRSSAADRPQPEPLPPWLSSTPCPRAARSRLPLAPSASWPPR